MNKKNLLKNVAAVLLILSILALPVLAADNSTQGILKKGSSDEFYNGLDDETKGQIDWLTSGISFLFKYAAIIALMVCGIIIMLARKRHNAHEESEGMESVFKIVIVVFLVGVAISLLAQIFKY